MLTILTNVINKSNNKKTMKIGEIEIPDNFFLSTLSRQQKNKILLRWEIFNRVSMKGHSTTVVDIATSMTKIPQFENVTARHIENEYYRTINTIYK